MTGSAGGAWIAAAGAWCARGDWRRSATIERYRFAQAKLKTIPADELAKIAALTDVQVLTDLVNALGQARTASAARVALARALSR